jgi:hypothetical protein
MSGCKIKRNLVSGGSGSSGTTSALKNSINGGDCSSGDKNCGTEVNSKLAAMMAERDKQDKDLSKVMTEAEYEAKYGKQPVGDAKPK